MKAPGEKGESASLPRPTGVVQPGLDRAGRALAALNNGRLADAEKHIAAIDDAAAHGRAWKQFLLGKFFCEKGDFSAAEAPLRRCVALALEIGLGKGAPPSGSGNAVVADADAVRLAAAGLETLGLALRRQDRPTEACRVHGAAFRLRAEHGSYDEMWESAASLGLAAGLSRRPSAESWFRRAAVLAERASIAGAEKAAIALTHLASWLTGAGRHEEAVATARSARDRWRGHDVGSLDAARSDIHLAHAMIRWGEAQYSVDALRTRELVGHALRLLEAADDSLAAFGPPAAADSARRAELVDFARRWLAMCGS